MIGTLIFLCIILPLVKPKGCSFHFSLSLEDNNIKSMEIKINCVLEIFVFNYSCIED